MGKTLDNFEKTIKDLEDFNLPEYKELPDIALYMEQIVGYIDDGGDIHFRGKIRGYLGPDNDLIFEEI